MRDYLGGPSVVRGVFVSRAGESDLEGDVTMEAEIGVRETFEDFTLLALKMEGKGHEPKYDGCPQKLEKARQHSSLEPPEATQPC